jgi:hypothetical protein
MFLLPNLRLNLFNGLRTLDSMLESESESP